MITEDAQSLTVAIVPLRQTLDKRHISDVLSKQSTVPAHFLSFFFQFSTRIYPPHVSSENRGSVIAQILKDFIFKKTEN